MALQRLNGGFIIIPPQTVTKPQHYLNHSNQLLMAVGLTTWGQQSITLTYTKLTQEEYNKLADEAWAKHKHLMS